MSETKLTNLKSKIKAIYLSAVNYGTFRTLLANGKVSGCGITEVSFKEPCVLFNFDVVVNYADGSFDRDYLHLIVYPKASDEPFNAFAESPVTFRFKTLYGETTLGNFFLLAECGISKVLKVSQ